MQNGDAQRQGLEVEEDFDLVKLGFIPDRSEAKSLEKIGDHHVDNLGAKSGAEGLPLCKPSEKTATIPSKAEAGCPMIAGLRSGSRKYTSADWYPGDQLVGWGRRGSGDALGTSQATSSSSPPPPVIEQNVVAHDYAVSTDAPVPTPLPNGDASMHVYGGEPFGSGPAMAPVRMLNGTSGGSAASTPSLASGILTSTETTTETPASAPTKPRTFNARLITVRRPGKRDRIGVRITRITRSPSDLEQEEEMAGATRPEDEAAPAPRPPPPDSHFLRELDSISLSESNSDSDVLAKLRIAAKMHNTTGTLLPEVMRDLLPALSDRKQAIQIANDVRRNFDLPALPTRMDRVALVKVLAQMRERLYMELAAALVLPNAPHELPPETPGEEKISMSMIPSSFDTLSRTLPLAFHQDRHAIKAMYDSKEGLYGEEGDVVWIGGVGRMRSRLKDGHSSMGYRSEEAEGLVHAFVDHSNILHGLAHHLYSSPLPLPPRHQRILALECLSLLLLRGRPTRSAHLVASSPFLQNLDPLVRLGWEVSVLKRVEVYEDEVVDPGASKLTPKAVPRIPANGTHAAGHAGGTRRYKEQGVDEILTLKMLQLVNRVEVKKGSTIVLATGDARGGQFNKEGFLGAVKEAVSRGWIVELWSFSSGLSRAWKETAKREGWGGQFRIYVLDDWAVELVEVNEEAE